MEFFQKYKKVFLWAGIFVAVVIIYRIFFAGSSAPAKSGGTPALSGLVSELSVSQADAIVGRELLTMLGDLKSISLDTSFFASPVLGSLQDWSKPLDPQPFGKTLGRRNPFSDFAKGSAGSFATTTR